MSVLVSASTEPAFAWFNGATIYVRERNKTIHNVIYDGMLNWLESKGNSISFESMSDAS